MLSVVDKVNMDSAKIFSMSMDKIEIFSQGTEQKWHALRAEISPLQPQVSYGLVVILL